MTTRKALAERLGAAIKNLLAHQWSHCRPAMSTLQELIDAAEAAREALAQPALSDEAVWRNDEIMAINARAGLQMPTLLELVRAIEHAQEGKANNG
jgi:hypothetical protein